MNTNETRTNMMRYAKAKADEARRDDASRARARRTAMMRYAKAKAKEA